MFSFLGRRPDSRPPARRRWSSFPCYLENLEDRLLLSAHGTSSYGAEVHTLTPVAVTPTLAAAAAANKLVFVLTPAKGTAGKALSAIKVAIETSAGKIITSDKSTVTLSIQSGSGAFSSGVTVTAKAVKGVATFSGLKLNVAGAFQLAAIDGTLQSATSAQFTVSPAAASKLAFTQIPGTADTGNTLTSIQVSVEDSFGNIVATSTKSITLAVQSGPGSFATGSTVAANAVNGVATFANLKLNTAGTYTLKATSAPLKAGTSPQVVISLPAPATTPNMTTPNILLSPTTLADLRQEAQANTPQWQAFKARLDSELDKVIAYDEAAYQGSELTWIADYALGYQILKTSDPLTAANYADKAIALMKSGLNDYQKGGWVGEQFLAQGDGKTTSFTLPNADLLPSSLLVWIAPVTTQAVVHGDANGQDDVSYYQKFLKVSNTSNGTANYVQGTDWQQNGDYQNNQIDWSLSGKEPAAGSTYYVTMTSALDGVRTSDYTLSGNTITFKTAPSAGQAVFVQYVYGTHSANGSTLAYQQTSAGDGGFDSILIDDTYTSRYLGKYIAMGLDWLSGYVGLTPALQQQTANMLVRWSNYTSANGYLIDSPASNYADGAYVSNVMTALALQGRDSRAPQLMADVLAYRNQYVIPALTNETSSLKGGFWAEGWNYGNLAAQNLLLAGDALEQDGQIVATAEHQWANEVIENLVSAQSASDNLYDGGDWYQYPAKFLDKSLFYVLSSMAGNASDRGYANYILQHYPASSFADPADTSDFSDMLFHDPQAPAQYWSDLPLANYASGTGLLTARSDWGSNPTWISLQMGNLLDADHQTYAPGQMEISRGPDQLLINAQAAGFASQNVPPTAQSQYSNALAIDDNGDGLLQHPFSMGVWYGNPGVVTKAYEATDRYVYMYGDYHAAYSASDNPGAGGPASELTRQIVYIRPGYEIVFDRATTIKDTYPKELRWNFLQPPTVSGNTFIETVGNSRLFGATFSTVPLTTTLENVQLGNTTGIQRVVTQNATPTASVRYVTAFQVTDAQTPTMVPTQSVVTTDGRMQGVQMDDQVVLFGTDGDVSLVTPATYSITSTGTIHHLLTNLAAGQTFQVTDNGVVVATLTSSSQGTLSFDTTTTGDQTIEVQQATSPVPQS